MKLKATIIIPSKNRYLLLKRCLNSIKKQNIDRNIFEVIVIDDNNSDKRYKKLKNNRIVDVLIRNNICIGPGNSRNKGIDIAKGELILFCDDDTIVPTNWIKQWLKFFELNSNCAGAAGKIIPLSKNNFVQKWCSNQKYSWRSFQQNRLNYIVTANSAFKKDALIEVGCFSKEFDFAGEDMDLTEKLMSKGFELKFNENSYLKHRMKNTVFEVMRTYFLYGIGNINFNLKYKKLSVKKINSYKRFLNAINDIKERKKIFNLNEVIILTILDIFKYIFYYAGIQFYLLKNVLFFHKRNF